MPVWGFVALAFPVPLAVAVVLGLRAGRAHLATPKAFGVAAAWAVAWAVAWVFLWHALWLTSVLPAPWSDTVQSAFSWTVGTGALWLPVLVITLVLRALKTRRE